MRFSSTNWGDYLFSQNLSEMLFFISIWNVYCAPNTLEQEMCVRLPVHVCVWVCLGTHAKVYGVYYLSFLWARVRESPAYITLVRVSIPCILTLSAPLSSVCLPYLPCRWMYLYNLST